MSVTILRILEYPRAKLQSFNTTAGQVALLRAHPLVLRRAAYSGQKVHGRLPCLS